MKLVSAILLGTAAAIRVQDIPSYVQVDESENKVEEVMPHF